MDLDESLLRDWENDDFPMPNDEDIDFAIASSLQSQYTDSSNAEIRNNQADETFLKSLDEDLDYAFALSLQTEFEDDLKEKSDIIPERTASASKYSKPLSIVDEQWELIDPSPDVHALFLEFDAKFFYKKLLGVVVTWSPRMYMCAGICCYEGRGGLCSIRLSLPLLKLRPRRDLVETLLHEMIHAYLFVTHNNRDREGHGPEFLSHMNRINKETGTRISVYHSFHDEVDLYRQHWWKCDGPCKGRRPFYGLVKRTMNRAPGPNDNWWSAHQASCGGNFVKIREPENYKKKGPKRKVASDSNSKESHSDIRSFMKVPKLSSSKNNPSKPLMTKSSNVSTITSVLSKEDTATAVKSKEISPQNNFIPFKGGGRKLGGDSSKVAAVSPFLSEYANGTSSSSRQKTWPPSSSGKSLESAPPLQFPKIPRVPKTSDLKNKDISSPCKVPDSPSKKLVQSPIKNFFSAKETTGSRNQLQKRTDNVNVPKTKVSDRSDSANLEVACPICSVKVKNSEINSHLDECLFKN